MTTGTSWPNRIWERDETGFYSRPVTPEDWERREEFEQWLNSKQQERFGNQAECLTVKSVS